jgi:uncharacterized protein YndB with AHSA1/START domain
MTGTEMVVRRRIVVEAPIEKAFAVFTGRFGDFKPPEHNIMRSPIAETVFEPRVGGHIYDRGEDGTECRWARILAFEPPDRVVFSWDIGPTWQVEQDPEHTSEVEVRFIAETPQRTRVELEHRNLDRHGPGWESVSAVHRGELRCRRPPPASTSTVRRPTCSPTPPIRPGSTSGSRVSSTATWNSPGRRGSGHIA